MMVMSGIPYIAVVMLVVYKLGKLIWTYKTGLMAVLMLGVASHLFTLGLRLFLVPTG